LDNIQGGGKPRPYTKSIWFNNNDSMNMIWHDHEGIGSDVSFFDIMPILFDDPTNGGQGKS
jgi:hypothetical protein